MKVKNFDYTKEQKNRNSKAIKVLLVTFCVLIVGAVVLGYLLYDKLTEKPGESLKQVALQETNVVEAAVAVDSVEVIAQTPRPSEEIPGAIVYDGKTYVRNPDVINLLFLGIDTNTERKIARDGYRSDMVMVCAINIETSQATLLSIPRDTYTTVYKLDKNTGEIETVIQDKINTAYSYGGGATKFSYPNAMACVEMFLERRCELETPLGFELEIPVSLYAGIDMDGIAPIASAVGGVKITLERGIPGVGSKGQTVTLKYKNAENYLRARHGTGGDLERAYRQQKFMIALAKKIKDEGSSDLVKTVLSLYDEVQRYVWTKLTTDQMLDLAKTLRNTDIDAIDMITIPGTGKTQSGTYYLMHDEQATLEILLDIYYEEVS